MLMKIAEGERTTYQESPKHRLDPNSGPLFLDDNEVFRLSSDQSSHGSS